MPLLVRDHGQFAYHFGEWKTSVEIVTAKVPDLASEVYSSAVLLVY